MTTEDMSAHDGVDAAPAESEAGLPVHRLLAALAGVEDALRARPDSPELHARAAALVRQLRDRAARPDVRQGPVDPLPPPQPAPGHEFGPDLS